MGHPQECLSPRPQQPPLSPVSLAPSRPPLSLCSQLHALTPSSSSPIPCPSAAPSPSLVPSSIPCPSAAPAPSHIPLSPALSLVPQQLQLHPLSLSSSSSIPCPILPSSIPCPSAAPAPSLVPSSIPCPQLHPTSLSSPSSSRAPQFSQLHPPVSHQAVLHGEVEVGECLLLQPCQEGPVLGVLGLLVGDDGDGLG